MILIKFPTFNFLLKPYGEEVANTFVIYSFRGNKQERILSFDYVNCKILCTYSDKDTIEFTTAFSIVEEFLPDISNLLFLLLESEKTYLIENYKGLDSLKFIFVKNRKDFERFLCLANSLYSDLYIQRLLKEENK